MTRSTEQRTAQLRNIYHTISAYNEAWADLGNFADSWTQNVARWSQQMATMPASDKIDEYDRGLDQISAALAEYARSARGFGLPVPKVPHLQERRPVVVPRSNVVAVKGDPMSNAITLIGAGARHGGHYRSPRHVWRRGGVRPIEGRRVVYDGGELTDLGALHAPGSGGFTVTLDPGDPATPEIIKATICVDGTCYSGTVNLSALVPYARQVGTDFHNWLHAQQSAGDAPIDGAAALQRSPAPVAAAGALLVGAMLSEHQAESIAGWWSSISKAAHKAASGVAGTLKKLRGPIATAAGFAAGAAAAAIPGAGPVLAPVAGKIASSMVNAATGTGSAKAAAQAIVDQAHEVAKTDPDMAKVLDVAHKAVAETTSAYHVAATLADASAGDKDAITKIEALGKNAAAGDPAAQKAMEIADGVTMAASAAQGAASGGGAGATISGDLVGAGVNIADARREAMSSVARSTHPGAIGYVKLMTGQQYRVRFPNADKADDWFGSLEPGSYWYAAYFDRNDPTWPNPLNEDAWHNVAGVHVSGVPLLPFLLGTGLGVGSVAAWHWWEKKHPPQQLSTAEHAHPQAPVTASGMTPLDHNRQIARGKARALRAPFVLVLRDENGAWYTEQFQTVEALDDRYGAIADRPDTYDYLVAFDKQHGGMRNESAPVVTMGMPAWLPLAGAGALGAGLLGYQWWRGRHAKAAQAPVAASGEAYDPIFLHIPCVDEDGNVAPFYVMWPTSQNRYHGGRAPDVFAPQRLTSHAGTNDFVWFGPDYDRSRPIPDQDLDKSAMRFWKPTWKVTEHAIEARRAG